MTTIWDRTAAVAADLAATDKIPVHRTGQPGGNSIVLSEFGAYLGNIETYAGALSGAGTIQATATLLAANKNIATTVTGANNAFRMPAGTSQLSVCALFNDDSADNAQLFPASGENIGAGVDAAFSIAPGDYAVFAKKSATAWFFMSGTVFI